MSTRDDEDRKSDRKKKKKKKDKKKKKKKKDRPGRGPGGDGKVTICHLPPGDAAHAHTIEVSESAVDAHLDHGDYLGQCEDVPPAPMQDAVLVVRKYEDRNGNGRRDGDEPGLAGWRIRVASDDGDLAADGTTDERGVARFLLPAGAYLVCEVLEAGWLNTEPGSGRARPCERVSAIAGERVRVRFGNARVEPPPPDAVILDVEKYEDANRNARRDRDEPGLAGWRIRVFDAAGEPVARASTAEGGLARFRLPPGEYLVCETLEEGWVNTDPGEGRPRPCKRVTAGAGEREPVRLGNARAEPPPAAPAIVDVEKYHDRNRNARRERDEPVLSGWLIRVLNPDGRPVTEAVTGDVGRVRFRLPAGEYWVCEVLQEGWVNTDPGEGWTRPCKPVTAVAGERAPLRLGNDRREPPAEGESRPPPPERAESLTEEIMKELERRLLEQIRAP